MLRIERWRKDSKGLLNSLEITGEILSILEIVRNAKNNGAVLDSKKSGYDEECWKVTLIMKNGDEVELRLGSDSAAAAAVFGTLSSKKS